MGRGPLRHKDTTASQQRQAVLGEEDLLLVPHAQRAYDTLVHPNSILPVSRYYLQNWLPLLGTSRAWLAIAFRQVAFVSRKEESEVSVQTTLRQLGRWCGLTHVRIHQVLKDPDLLTWFVRGKSNSLTQHQGPRSQPDTFLVRSDIPLTPADQYRLEEYLRLQAPQNDQEWLEAIVGALEARNIHLPAGSQLPRIPLTIQNIVYTLRGEKTPLPPSLDQACTELHARWVQPDRVSLITHYFIKRWLPNLSSGLGWLVVLLRSRSFQQDDSPVGQTWAQNGWSTLADELGVSRKSITRWAASADAQRFFIRRDNVSDPSNTRSALFAVRISEPIHPLDEDEYQELLAAQHLTDPNNSKGHSLTSDRAQDGQDLTSTSSDPGQLLTSDDSDQGQNLPDPGQNLPPEGNHLTTPRQNLTSAPQNLTTTRTELNNFGTELNALSTLSTQTRLIQDDSQLLQFEERPIFSDGVANRPSWQIEQILIQAGSDTAVRQNLLNASPEAQQYFIAWLLFGLSRSGINFPVLFACRRMNESLPPDVFLRLSSVPPERLMNWMTGRETDIEADFETVIASLRKQGAAKKMLELRALPENYNTDMNSNFEYSTAFQDRQESSALPKREAQAPRANQRNVKSIWSSLIGQLQKELPRATFETWIRDTLPLEMSDSELKVGVENEFARDWLEHRCTSIYERILIGINSTPIKVIFEVLDDENIRG
jgi:hypothetical protein